MKLYATTTSERASKGQGGNKYVRTDYFTENGERKLCVIIEQLKQDEAHISVSSVNGDEIKQVYRHSFINTKGKQKKDEQSQIYDKGQYTDIQ